MALLFWMIVLGLESMFWLGKEARLILFLVGMGGTIYLLLRFIIRPAIYLLRMRKGLTPIGASRIIGDHFPAVGDRLLNLLELAEDPQKSELLLASIQQRSNSLRPVPFLQAIQYKKSLVYAKYLLIPFLIFAGIWVSGNAKSFFGSFERVVNYDLAYEKPAPFRFVVISGETQTIEKEDYEILVSTEGAVLPELSYIIIDGNRRLMQQENGKFSYTFKNPVSNQDFYFEANEVRSRPYTLEVIPAPLIQEFESVLEYPLYLSRPGDTLRGTGNAVVPEGTKVTWKIKAANTEEITFRIPQSSRRFIRQSRVFELDTVVYADLQYQLTTSNTRIENYEQLDYRIRVVKDASPVIEVAETRDSIDNTLRYEGRARDDYEIVKLELIYYEMGKEDSLSMLLLDQPLEREYSFEYDFPTGLDLDRGKTYNFYFRVTDNDGIRKGKSAQSQVFNTAILDERQEKEQRLKEQREVLDVMDKTLDNLNKREEELRELEQTQKEKNILDYNDQRAIKDFLKNQQQQEALMEKFSKKLQETLGDTKGDEKIDELLRERLERQEIEARKNERLLEELRKIADKIDKEELTKKLEELGKSQQNSKRNLSQLLELTKRYYVTEKADEIANKLMKLADKEEVLSKIDQDQEFNISEQEKINKSFEDIQKDLDELRKANQELAKPLAIETGKEKEEEVKDDLKKALEEMAKEQGKDKATEDTQDQENSRNEAIKKQREAATKMRQMGETLQQSGLNGASNSMAEDAEMLRQILDNLIIFSFKQESLFDKVKESGDDRGYYANVVKEEQQLRSLFEHVDDSLFSLSLRQAEISEFVNEQITEVYYNIDQSLESLAEGQIYQGASYQQYVLTAANNLADFLANVLENMQQNLSQGGGSGKQPDGFQLPDIIKEQKGVQQQLEGMDKKGKEGQKGKGEDGNSGEGEKGDKGLEKGNNETPSGSEEGDNEEQLEELFEIYKQQQILRAKLENQLENLIDSEDRDLAKRLIKQMEDFERDLIENGITRRSIDRVNRIQQQLMKLENAALEQGEKQERESEKPRKSFGRPLVTNRNSKKQKEGQLELLQRQVLPLRDFYREVAKKYFREDD
jgi:hypothetical protein